VRGELAVRQTRAFHGCGPYRDCVPAIALSRTPSTGDTPEDRDDDGARGGGALPCIDSGVTARGNVQPELLTLKIT
jgi:hypothetical protein